MVVARTNYQRYYQGYPRSFSREPAARRRLFPQPPRHAPTVNNQSISDTITASHSTVSFKIISRSLTHTVTTSDLIRRILRDVPVSVSHDVTSSQVLRGSKVIYLAVSHTATTSQALINASSFVNHVVTATHSIGINVVVHRSVTQTVLVSDLPYVNSPRLVSISHTIIPSHSIDARNATKHVSVTDTVTVVHFPSGRLGTYRFSVAHTVTASQSVIRRDAIYRLSVTDTATVSHRTNTIYPRRVDHDVMVAHIVHGNKQVTKTVTSTVSAGSTFSYNRDIVRTLTSILLCGSVFKRNIVVTRTLTPPLLVRADLSGLLLTDDPDHPVSTSIPIVTRRRLILSGIGTIELPAPEFENTDGYKGAVDLRRSITGVLYAYAKTTPNVRTLKYDFILGLPKARELASWFAANRANTVLMTDWRGQVWQVKVSTDDLILTSQMRWAGNDREKVTVTLEFEGVRVFV